MNWFKKMTTGKESKNANSSKTSTIEQNNFLEMVKYSDVEYFNLNGHKTWTKCVKVYDGDTGTFVFFLYGKPYKFRIRLADIDTAELKSDDVEEVEYANRAKDRLMELIGNNLVYLECLRWDKYGRLLGKIYQDNITQKSINQILLDEHLAYKYNGGKRVNFREWATPNELAEIENPPEMLSFQESILQAKKEPGVLEPEPPLIFNKNEVNSIIIEDNLMNFDYPDMSSSDD